MKSFRLLILAALLLNSLALKAFAQNGEAYRISIQDTLVVSVQDHAELAASTSVLPDGTVVLPLIGTLQAEGLTVAEFQAKLVELYNQKYIANPSVMVNLAKNKIGRVYVYGEVKTPGVYELSSGLTALRAIVTAGGFTEYSSKTGVKVLRTENGKEEVFKINVKNIEKGALKEDLTLQPEDVVIVPEAII